jgi:hypothetical protein
MASVPVKREYVGEYIHGMGNNFFLIRATSPGEIRARYPLLAVSDIEESKLPSEYIEMLRMYPGEGRPLDSAVLGRSQHERASFIAAAIKQRETAHERYVAAKFPIPEHEAQRWVDLDDDAEFRMQMHELWKDDMRYRELPPEQRLF